MDIEVSGDKKNYSLILNEEEAETLHHLAWVGRSVGMPEKLQQFGEELSPKLTVALASRWID